MWNHDNMCAPYERERERESERDLLSTSGDDAGAVDSGFDP
jgi:hypothetical protein